MPGPEELNGRIQEGLKNRGEYLLGSDFCRQFRHFIQGYQGAMALVTSVEDRLNHSLLKPPDDWIITTDSLSLARGYFKVKKPTTISGYPSLMKLEKELWERRIVFGQLGSPEELKNPLERSTVSQQHRLTDQSVIAIDSILPYGNQGLPRIEAVTLLVKTAAFSPFLPVLRCCPVIVRKYGGWNFAWQIFDPLTNQFRFPQGEEQNLASVEKVSRGRASVTLNYPHGEKTNYGLTLNTSYFHKLEA